MTATWAASIKNWQDDVLVTATDMNTEVRDRMEFLNSQPGARVYNNAAISIPNATWTALQFNSERYDVGYQSVNCHDLVTNPERLTIPMAGKYLITANIFFAANATGVRAIRIKLNNTTTYIAHLYDDACASHTILSLTTVYHLSANDYLVCEVYQTSGAALNVSVGDSYSPEFAIQRLTG